MVVTMVTMVCNTGDGDGASAMAGYAHYSPYSVGATHRVKQDSLTITLTAIAKQKTVTWLHIQ